MKWVPMWGFQFLLILDLWGISFPAVIVFGLDKNLLFQSVLGHCEMGQIFVAFSEYPNIIKPRSALVRRWILIKFVS